MNESSLAVSVGGLIAIGLFLNPISAATITSIGTSAALGTLGVGLIVDGIKTLCKKED